MFSTSSADKGRSAPDLKPLFLIYHELGPGTQPYSYFCGTEQFEKHLQVAAEFRSAANARSRIPNVTFDDGHISQHSYALPLLEQYAMNAIFFVTAGWINSRDEYMQWSHLRELHTRGHQIQSHSWSHPMLTHCSDSELEKELAYSRQLIEDKVGAAVDAISIPHGRWNHRVLRACVAAGYQRIFTSDSWRKEEQRTGARVYGRINVPQSLNAEKLRMFAQDGGWKRMYDLRAYSKYLLRQLIGDQIYHRLWRVMARAGEAR